MQFKEKYIKQHGKEPTILEIAKEFNKSSNTKTIDVTPKKEVTKTVTPSVLTNSSPNPVFFQ